MFQVSLETHIKLIFSNSFLVIIKSSILRSNNTGNLPLRKGFQNPHIAFYLKQMDKPNWKFKFKLKLFWRKNFQSWIWSFSAPIFFAELELKLLGSIFSAQSWSWSLKALGVKLEPAPNRSQLSISVISLNSIFEPYNPVCVIGINNERFEALCNICIYVCMCLKAGVNYGQPIRVIVFFVKNRVG